MKHGEELTFSGIPAGTRYVVTETGTSGYTPSVAVVENGIANETIKGTKGENLSSVANNNTNNTNLVGEGKNSVTFTNKYDD